MAETIMNPSSARKNFYKLLKEVKENHTEIEIVCDRSENNAVLIGMGRLAGHSRNALFGTNWDIR